MGVFLHVLRELPDSLLTRVPQGEGACLERTM